jgi:hypothetical protein
MNGRFSKCGATCARCPAYRENASTPEDRQQCSDGWHKYLGVRLSVQRCYCDGCQTPDDRDPIFVIGTRGCKIRRCAVFNGVETCAHCSAYPCEAVRTQFSFDPGARERFAARFGAPIPEEEYLTFIEPYELHKHLESVRATLGPKDIVEMTPVPVKPRIVGFPPDLPLRDQEIGAFKALHHILADAGTAAAVPHAQRTALQRRRQHLLKILWAFGRLGESSTQGEPHLVLEGDVYLAQKIQSVYATLMDYFDTLHEYGVHCEHVPRVEAGWLTPKGALRRGGWDLRLSFSDQAGGPPVLKALITYVAKLDQAYGKQAFRRFSAADMRILG